MLLVLPYHYKHTPNPPGQATVMKGAQDPLSSDNLPLKALRRREGRVYPLSGHRAVGAGIKCNLYSLKIAILIWPYVKTKLHGIENNIWLSCGSKKITAFADEDLERSTDNKTSAVHFLRFQLDQDDITEFLSNEKISLGVNHSEYNQEIELASNSRASLVKDLNNN